MPEASTATTTPPPAAATTPKSSLLVVALPDLPSLTVEPTFALYSLAETMSKFTFQNLLMQKSCRDNATTEPDLQTPCDDENRGGTFVALANSFFITPAFFWIVFYTLAAVTWSEQAGRRRKPLLYLPLIGLTIETAAGAFNSFFWSLSPYISIVMYTMAQIFFGGRVCMVQGTYLYLMDTCDHETRTFRFALVMTTRYACMVIGYTASGYMLHGFGFFYSFAVSFALISAALLVERLAVPDISYPIEQPKSFLQMINPKRTVELMKRITYRERSGYDRCLLAVTLLVFMLFTLINEGELSVLFLYLQRTFKWSVKKVGIFHSYKLVAACMGSVIVSLVFVKTLQLKDSSILVFMGITKVVAATSLFLAKKPWQIYSIPILDMFFAGGISVCRSFASSLVERPEYGSLSMVLTLTKISNSLTIPIYSGIYSMTQSTFPNFMFLTSISLSALILTCSVIILVLYTPKSNTREDKR